MLRRLGRRRDLANAERQRDLAVSLAKLGQMADVAGDGAIAFARFTEACDAFEAVCTISPTHAEARRMADLASADAERNRPA